MLSAFVGLSECSYCQKHCLLFVMPTLSHILDSPGEAHNLTKALQVSGSCSLCHPWHQSQKDAWQQEQLYHPGNATMEHNYPLGRCCRDEGLLFISTLGGVFISGGASGLHIQCCDLFNTFWHLLFKAFFSSFNMFVVYFRWLYFYIQLRIPKDTSDPRLKRGVL